MGLSSEQEEISASNNNWSVVSGRLDIPLTSKRYTPEIMGLMGMRVLGNKEMNLGAVWIRTLRNSPLKPLV